VILFELGTICCICGCCPAPGGELELYIVQVVLHDIAHLCTSTWGKGMWHGEVLRPTEICMRLTDITQCDTTVRYNIDFAPKMNSNMVACCTRLMVCMWRGGSSLLH
jgi:hypothetical protein